MTQGSYFWSLVGSPTFTGCWEWLGARDKDGYGYVYLRDKKRNEGTHRVAYKLTYGEIPTGMCVCHSCDNPSCCNPQHLWLGTNLDNVRDRVKKGRSACGDRNGSIVNPERLSRGIKHSEIMRQVSAKGKDNGMAVLTEEQVREIRQLGGVRKRGRPSRNSKYVSNVELAARFGVSNQMISCILSGRNWK